MKRKKVSFTGRKIIIIPAAVLGVIVLLLAAAYLYIHGFIQKMNLVTSSDGDYAQAARITEEKAGRNTTDHHPERGSGLYQAYEDEAAGDGTGEEVKDEEDALTDIPAASEKEIAILEEKIRKNMEENQTPIKYDKEVFNVLLIGSDARKAGGNGRSDAMMLVSINKRTKKIIVTSILRDIYLQIPGREKSNRINTAYASGGADLLMDTVEQNFKIKVDKYASINFYAFIDIVDAVGGVTLEVTKEDIPVINNYVKELNKLTSQEKEKDCLTQSGTLLLNGKQALGYSRNRYVGNADFERTARQREVLEQLYEKIKSLKLTELKKLLNLILPQITTNLTEGEIFSMILSLPAYVGYDIVQWSIPKAGTYSGMNIRGMAVLGINFDANTEELHNKVYDKD